LDVGLDIQWPNAFKTFLNWFNPANLDFVQLSSVGCVVRATYYTKLWTFCAIPPILIGAIMLLYWLPWYMKHRAIADEPTRELQVKILRKRTWRLVLFTLFLIYPSVSSFVLRLYVCRHIEGVDYLASDFNVICYDSAWNANAGVDAFMILIYPIGVLSFLFFMLYRYRTRLDETGVRAQLGFLYDAYERKIWYFELIDMLHKLLITSIVAFFPPLAQMPVAMVIVTGYLMVLLATRPYIRKGDDRLHQFAQVEIFLLLMAGNNFNSQDTPDPLMDDVMSVVLILAFCVFILFFLIQCYVNLRKIIGRRCFGEEREKKVKDPTRDTISGETDLPTYDRSNKFVANGRQSVNEVNWARNPAFAGTALADDTANVEMVATVNPLHAANQVPASPSGTHTD